MIKEFVSGTHPNMFNNAFAYKRLRIGIGIALLIFGLASIGAAAPTYSASEVDSPPRIIRQMPVKYPPMAKREGITGKVVVRCLIGTNGRAEQMQVVESTPKGIFDQSALRTLKYWQFRPGILKGRLVATWVQIPFSFK